MAYLSQSDEDLIRAVIDKDAELFGQALGDKNCTSAGVSRALYLSACFGIDDFSDMLIHSDNEKFRWNGNLIHSIAVDDDILFYQMIERGADIRHNNDMPLQCAVKALRRDYADELIQLGCDLDRAFPEKEMHQLFRKAVTEIDSQKVLDYISELQSREGHARRGHKAQIFKLRIV